jgi:hypothetical protein
VDLLLKFSPPHENMAHETVHKRLNNGINRTEVPARAHAAKLASAASHAAQYHYASSRLRLRHSR